jgi:hypothetical protein
MATYDETEILVGAPATILIGLEGGTSGGANEVGYTMGQTIMNVAVETLDVTPDQEVWAVKGVVISKAGTVNIPMLQSDLINLAIGMGYSTSAVSTGVFTFGDEEFDGATIYREIYMEGPGPAGDPRVIHLERVLPKGGIPYNLEKGAPTVHTVPFVCYKATSGQVGTITDL